MMTRLPFSRRRFITGAAAAIVSPLIFPASRLLGAVYPDHAFYLEKYCQTMGAIASVSVYGPDREFCRAAVKDAFNAMRSVDKMMSSFDPRSALNLVNNRAGRDAVAVPADLFRVMEGASTFWRATGGAFDVTIGPLLDLYGFFSQGPAGPFPTDRVIARTLDSVGFRNVVIDSKALTVGILHQRTRIDLGGIAVGYALDLAGAALRARGVTAALINHSGDILAIGAPPGTRGWEIGIQDPTDSRGTIKTLLLKDESVSTSGNYENIRRAGDRTIGHIIDPFSGGSSSRFLSVTVTADSSLAADALSTGIFAGGLSMLNNEPLRSMNVKAFTVPAGVE